VTKLRWLKEIIKKEHEGPFFYCFVQCDYRCKWLHSKEYEYDEGCDEEDKEPSNMHYCTRNTNGVITNDSIFIGKDCLYTPIDCPFITQEQKDMMRKARLMNKK
jgi:hypothetical protein